MTITTHSEEETSSVGQSIARSLAPGSIVLLQGELGAGKTAFVRGMAEGLGIDPREVSSPTFTLIQHYDGGRLPLHHVDLYRLGSIEVESLGLEELTSSGGVTAIEWPDRLPQPFDDCVLVRIEHEDDETRTILIARASPATSER
jgi:tRNA threonylcarbamoyladenosine biosynthesis protein TsaE